MAASCDRGHHHPETPMMHLLLLALFHIDDLFHLAVVLICEDRT